MKSKTKHTLSRWYRVNLWIHRWISLIIVIPFTILSITGVILIFHEEIDHLMGLEAQALDSPSVIQRPLADSINTVQQAFPDKIVFGTGYDPQDHPGVFIVGMAKSGQTLKDVEWTITDVNSAKIIEHTPPDETLTGFLLKLHAEWFLGPLGELIGAFIALLVLLSLISGLIIYAPYVRKFLFGIIRFNRGKRLIQLDLHNLIGSAVLGWALVVTMTGLLLGFGTIAILLWQKTELNALQQQYSHSVVINPDISIDQIYATAQQGQKGWYPANVFYPKTELSTASHYMVLLKGESGLSEKMLKVALINATTGQLDRIEELPFYLKLIMLSQPLHFGNYGGVALKILWTLCTLLTLFITMNGAWLWWKKRHKSSKPKGDAHEIVE